MSEIFKEIKKERASDIIVREIWQLIMSGKLQPGEKLPPERELVKSFNVSKVTLREALQTLEAYGYIERKRGATGGSIIMDIAPDQGISLILNYLRTLGGDAGSFQSEVFPVIMPTIAGLAAERITSDGIAELKTALKKNAVDLEAHGGSIEGWKFPILLAKLTKNPYWIVFTEILMKSEMDYEFAMGINDITEDPDEVAYSWAVYEYHCAIADAVMDGDKERAVQAALSSERLFETLKKLQHKR